MKDSIFSWHRILALCILLVHMTMMVPAQELYLGRQLGSQYLEQYLDRADLESSQQRWQELADQGMLVALTAWESAQTYLLEQDPQLWQRERAALERELAEEREVRLAQWLLDKYIQSQSNPKFQQLAMELQQRSSQWKYEHSDESGTVVATRQVEAGESQEAKDQWLKSNQQLIQEYLEENSLDTGLLESQLQDLNLDEATRRALVQESATSYQSYLATEYDLILRSETMDLMGNLLYDRESLRAASAKESADTIALTLIQEAKASTEISVKELFQDFQEDVNQNQLNEGQIHVEGEQWAHEFQRQLEEGLAVWDKVEVEFLSRRSQWEQEALETYEAGEEAWFEAFQKLKSARQEWENEIMAEFQQGMEEWNQSRLEQELEIEAAQEELVLSLQEEIHRKEELALFAITVYDQVRSLLASCYEGVENWYSNWAQKYNKVYSYWKTEDASGYYIRFSQGKVEGLEEALATNSNKEGEIDLEYLSASNTRNKIEAQVGQWKRAYLDQIKNEVEKEILQLESENQSNKNTLQALLFELKSLNINMTGDEIASRLKNVFLTEIVFDKNLWDSSIILLDQNTGWLVLAEAGFENLETASNNFFEAVDPTSLEGSSSDLDAEIQRLETTLSYWQDELAVAQVLKDYATTTTSFAETAQETQLELAASQKAFQQAEEDYKNHQQLIQEAYDAIQQAMIHLSEIKVELDEASSRAEQVKNQIVALNEVTKGLGKEVVESQIIKILDSLTESFSQEKNQEIRGLVESFFLQEMIQGNHVYTNTIEELLKTTALEGTSSQEELLFRQEVLSYLTQGEPESWQAGTESQEEQQYRQLIRDTYSTLRLDILNERHSQALRDIRAIVQEKDIWNFTHWDELVSTIKSLRDSGMNLHAGAASVLEQLIAVMIQHWCLQNPHKTTISQENNASQAFENPSSMSELSQAADSTEISLSRSEIQQQLTELQAMENNIFDIQEIFKFLDSPLFSQLDEEGQNRFIAYSTELMVSYTNFVDHLPISDGIAFLNQLNEAEYSWKNNFFQLSQNMQLVLAKKLEEITDIQSLQDNMIYLQSILKVKREALEENDFFLSLEELKNVYLQDSSQQELEALLENCSEIQESTLLSEEDLAEIQILFSENGLNTLKIQELQSLGEQWLTILDSCQEAPYEILSQAPLQDSQNPASQYLNQIAALLDVSVTKAALQEPVEIYVLLGTNNQELKKEKTILENQLAQEELQRQDSVNQYEKAAAMVNQTIAVYQLKLEEENNLYESLLQARLNLRIAEEKYQWASRIYLESIGSETAQESVGYESPLQRYNEVLLITSRYQKALEILVQMKNQQQLQNQEYLLQLEAYENALEKSYLMEVILSQANTAVAKQEEATREAELKDSINVSKLFASYESLFPSDEKTDTREDIAQGINSPALELIRISRGDNGSYTISLGYETNYVKTGTETSTDDAGNKISYDVYDYVTFQKTDTDDLNQQLLESYLTDTTETIVRVDDILQLTRAEVEVRQWLEEIYTKGDNYLNQLLLASLHLKTYSSNSTEMLDGQADIRDESAFRADQLPDIRNFHNIDTTARYNSERRDIVAAAYDFILSMKDGEEDLARYILYRETNLLDKNSWQLREKDLIEWFALDEVREDVADEQNKRNRDAAIAFASAAALSAAVVFFQPWLWVAAAAATIIGIAAADAAASLGAAKDGIYDLMKGNKENALKASETLNGLLSNLQEGKNNLQEQWKLLNLLYYGNETGPSSATENGESSPLSVEEVLASVQEMLEGNRFVSVHEYENLLNVQVVASLLEQDYSIETSSSYEKSLKVSDVLLQSSLQFQTEYLQAQEKLAQVVANVQEQSQVAMTGFYQVLGQSLEISQENKEKLLLLEAQATDESLSGTQRQLAMNEYQALYQSLFAMDGTTQKQLTNLASLAYGGEGWNNLLHKKNIYGSYKSLYNTKVDFASSTEEYTGWLQQLMVQQAISSFEDSALQILGQSQHQWQLERDLLDRRQGLWEAEVLETLAAGEKSWQRVEERLNKEYTLWRRSFQKELEERQGEWEQNYLDFLQKKESWVQESHGQGLIQGLVQKLVLDPSLVVAINYDELEVQFAHLSRNMESSVSSKMTEAIAESLLADSYLDQLIVRSSTLKSFGKNTGAGIKKIRRNTSSLESHLVAQELADKTNQLMKEVAGRQAADYGQDLLEKILASYMEGITNQNQAMVDWQERLARDAGYTVNGSIHRTIVVDATLLNPIKETQYLPVYQHFSATAPKLRKVEATSRENAMLQLGLAQRELELWGQKIFESNGLLEQHKGSVPELVSSPDATGSKKAAFKDLGSGQMGAILVDYYWNSIQARKGMEELSKAGHDKRLFDDRGLPFSAPTLREVAEVAMTVVGSATGQAWWFGYLDDAVFAGIDLGGGYKTAGEIGRELATKAVGAAIGAGTNWAGDTISGIKNTAGKMAAMTGLNLASGSLSNVTTVTLQSMNFDKIGTGDFFNGDMFTSMIRDKNSWASIVAGAASAGVSIYGSNFFGAMGAEANKFYGGAMNLATSVASQAASYGVYAAFHGGDWAEAYNAMGGINVNVASFGALADFVGSSIARNNSTGQNILGKVIDKLDGKGIMLNLGLEGVSTSVGSGGIDLSGNLYDLGKRAIDKRALESYAQSHGKEEAETVWKSYVYGDWTQENTSARLASGLDQLELVEQADFTALTTSNGSGGRLIQMVDSGNSYNNAITLGHESYRDGIIGTASQQSAETLAATTAHTQMALRMLGDGKGNALQMTENLAMDIVAYQFSQGLGNETLFSNYVAGNYDSSEDYWLFKLDGSIEDTAEKAMYKEYVDENGIVRRKKIEGSEYTGSRIKALVEVIGIENVKRMLPSNPKSIQDIPDHVLQSSFGWDEKMIADFKSNPIFINIGDQLLQSDEVYNLILGEMLMYENGGTWNSQTGIWNTGELKIPGLGSNDSLGITVQDDGSYQFFSAGLIFTREADAFDIYKNGKIGDSDTTYEQRDNTRISAWKRDLFTGETWTVDFENAATSIDRKSKTSVIVDGDVYTGNTLVSDYFKMRLIDSSNYHLSEYGVNQVGIFTDAVTLSGNVLNKAGYDGVTPGRYLYHPFGSGAGSEGCFGPMSDYGVSGYNNPNVSGTGAWHFQQQLDLFKEWGIYNGYEFNIQMTGKVRP